MKIVFRKYLKEIIGLSLILLTCLTASATDIPFAVKAGLYNQSLPDDLGLEKAEGTETNVVFWPTGDEDKFCNGVVMIGFKDSIYCQWQSSASDEDATDTWVAFSASKDGINWTKPRVLATSIDNGYCSSGGWYVNGDTLVGYINTWPNLTPRGGYTRYVATTDGSTWTDPKVVTMAGGDTLNGIFEQDPRAIPGGRIINAAHFQPGLIINPIYTDDPSGVRGWIKGDYTNLSISDNISQGIEPSLYQRGDGAIVLILRDQNSSYKKLASVSYDSAKTWTPVVKTSMPDARTKQSAGNIADSTVYMVGNPNDDKLRIPLVVTLSSDGSYFNTAYLLLEDHDTLPDEPRFSGTAKRKGFHYPKTMVWKDTMYVSYAYYKEDVMYTRVPLKSLAIDTSAGANPSLSIDENDISVTYLAGSDTLKVSTNIEYWVSESSSWLSTSKPNDSTLVIKHTQNMTLDPRSDTITIGGPFVESKIIVVEQEGGTSFTNAKAENEFSFTVFSNSNKLIIVQSNTLVNNATISLYNINGQEIYEGIMNGTEMIIELNDQPPGTYIVRFLTNNTAQSQIILLK